MDIKQEPLSDDEISERDPYSVLEINDHDIKIEIKKEPQHKTYATKTKPEIATIANCEKCGQPTEGTKMLNCSLCDKLYHSACLNMSAENFSKMNKLVRMRWKCPVCRESKKRKCLRKNLVTPLEKKSQLTKKDVCVVDKSMELFSCDICHENFEKKLVMIKHRRNAHNDDKLFECQECKKKIRKWYDYVSHLRMHTGERPFKCDMCRKAYYKKPHLISHIRTHTGERPYKCYVCDKGFSEPSHLKGHLEIHSAERPYECETCHEKFRLKFLLQRHMVSHININVFKCRMCNEAFRIRRLLKKHIYEFHFNKKPYECQVCGYKTSTNRLLRYHMFKHTHERPFHCDLCTNKYASQRSLDYHKLSHSNPQTTHKCETCGQTFVHRAVYKKHMQQHDEECQCALCGKWFLCSNDLSIHVKTHQIKKEKKPMEMFVKREIEVKREAIDVFNGGSILRYYLETGEKPYTVDMPSCSRPTQWTTTPKTYARKKKQ